MTAKTTRSSIRVNPALNSPLRTNLQLHEPKRFPCAFDDILVPKPQHFAFHLLYHSGEDVPGQSSRGNSSHKSCLRGQNPPGWVHDHSCGSIGAGAFRRIRGVRLSVKRQTHAANATGPRCACNYDHAPLRVPARRLSRLWGPAGGFPGRAGVWIGRARVLRRLLCKAAGVFPSVKSERDRSLREAIPLLCGGTKSGPPIRTDPLSKEDCEVCSAIHPQGWPDLESRPIHSGRCRRQAATGLCSPGAFRRTLPC